MLRRTCTSSLALRFAAGAPPPPPSSRGALLRHQRALAAAAWPSDEPLPAKLGPVNSPDIEQMLKRLPAGTHLGQHVMQEATNDTGRVGNCPYLSSHPLLSRTATRESSARGYARRFPVAVVKADGAVVEDGDGNKYLDCLAGAGTLTIGHNPPAVIEAMQEFLKSGHPQQLLDISAPAKDAFVTELLDTMPAAFKATGNLRTQFCSPAGTDVTEAAMKLARIATGRGPIISFSGGYHGHTLGALMAMGNNGSKEVPGLMNNGVQFMPYPYAYRCPFGLGGAQGEEAVAEYFERFLTDVESGVTKPAAVILEAVQGEGGVIPGGKAFLQRVRKVTEEHGIVMIIDEVQTGFGRTGKWFAHEHYGVAPDILCLSKAVGGGMPVGVMVYRESIDAWRPGAHAGTFRGNQIGLVAGAAGMRYSKEVDIPGQAARKGDYTRQRLLKLQEKFPDIIGDVRGLGFMLGVEVVDPKSPKDKIGARAGHGAFAAEVQARCFNNGMIMERGGRHGAVMRILAPVVITDSQLERMLDIYCEQVEKTADAHYGGAHK